MVWVRNTFVNLINLGESSWLNCSSRFTCGMWSNCWDLLYRVAKAWLNVKPLFAFFEHSLVASFLVVLFSAKMRNFAVGSAAGPARHTPHWWAGPLRRGVRRARPSAYSGNTSLLPWDFDSVVWMTPWGFRLFHSSYSARPDLTLRFSAEFRSHAINREPNRQYLGKVGSLNRNTSVALGTFYEENLRLKVLWDYPFKGTVPDASNWLAGLSSYHSGFFLLRFIVLENICLKILQASQIQVLQLVCSEEEKKLYPFVISWRLRLEYLL